MKNYMLLAAAVLLIVVGAAWARSTLTTQTPPGGEEVGRYEMHHMAYEFAEGDLKDVIFRLDTQTGQTWRYIPPVDLEDVPEGWIRVDEIADKDLLEEDNRFLP